MRIRIRVEAKDEILQENSTFWEGDSKDYRTIPNIPAQIAVNKLINTGVDSYKFGMWIAEKLKD